MSEDRSARSRIVDDTETTELVERGRHTPFNEPVPSPAPLSELIGRRILVVDDDPDTVEALKALLEHHGAIVDTAGSAKEALARAGRRWPDLLISDLGMPEQDGYELIQKLRGLAGAGRLRALAFSAFVRPEDRTRSLLAGFDLHLNKPADVGELLASLVALSRR
ncbi:MAG: response regulator [Myxococcaceae bacterium]